MSLTREIRDEWRALVNKATPGPWSQGMVGTRLINEVDNAAAFGAIIVKPEYSDDGAEGVADAEFIAESITIVPTLLDALDEAEATITGLREAGQDLNRAWQDYVLDHLSGNVGVTTLLPVVLPPSPTSTPPAPSPPIPRGRRMPDPSSPSTSSAREAVVEAMRPVDDDHMLDSDGECACGVWFGSLPAYDDHLNRARLDAALGATYTPLCPECGGAGYGAEQYASRGIGFSYPRCPSCNGSGRPAPRLALIDVLDEMAPRRGGERVREWPIRREPPMTQWDEWR